MTVCGISKADGMCVMGECPYIKKCCPAVWDKSCEPMTNEEWFCGLSTEEKVATLVDLHKKVRMKMRTEIGGENSLFNGDYHREWLKEKHDEMP